MNCSITEGNLFTKTDVYCLGFVLMKMDNIEKFKYNRSGDEVNNKSLMRKHYESFVKGGLPEESNFNKNSFFFPLIADMINPNPD